VNTYPSKLIENAVVEFAKLPGIGKKTAMRLVLHLLKQKETEVELFGEAIIKMRKETKFCKNCNNISDNDLCSICSSHKRDHSTICVVEDVRDVIAIENTEQYKGIYHVLGGIISPIEGIGPNDLNIQPLILKAKNDSISEIIMALPATMEGDTTVFYLYKQLLEYDINITNIARGIGVGDELEYADEITLARSIINRTPYINQFNSVKQ